MFPFCHSNGFSDIYEGGDGENVCKLDVGEVAFDNHPGGTGTNTRGDKKGWRAWKRSANENEISRNVEASEAMRVSGEHPFWLMFGNFTVGSYQNGEGAGAKTEYYISEIGPWKYTITWNAEKKKLVRGGNCIMFVSPRCDRLLLAQNVRLVKAGGGYAVDMSCARQDWYAPRKQTRFASNEDTNVRPYMPPMASVKGWPYDVIDLRHGETGTQVPQPPFGAPYWGDWRYNPIRAAEIHGETGLETIGNVNILANHAVSHGMSMEEMFTGRLDRNRPAPGYEAAWENQDENIDYNVMLYGWAENPKPSKEDPQYYEYSSIYWEKGGSYGAGPALNLNELADRLRGIPSGKFGSRPPILRDKTDKNGKIYNFLDNIDLLSAFDLRLYCKRIDLVIRPLMDDPDKPGKQKPDKSQKLRREYLGTKCWATVRQISPTPPRT